MERFPIGGHGPTDLKDLLGATEIVDIEGDDLDDEYLTLLWAHPGFQTARQELRAEFSELEKRGVFLDDSDREDARKGTAAAAYPLQKFAEKWGVSPAAAYALTRAANENYAPGDDNALFTHFRREANAVIIWEQEGGYTVYLPRPLTKPRRAAVENWLKGKKMPGRLEKLWGLSSKSRWQPSPAHIQALPWFKRWNDDEEKPVAIWRELQAQKPDLDLDSFVEQLARLAERMREISENEIRSDRPSKSRA